MRALGVFIIVFQNVADISDMLDEYNSLKYENSIIKDIKNLT